MKTVSVVMATYNGEKYIREQLDSIIQQTYPIHEIIIQDDCSTDGTVAIIEEYVQRYPNIKLFVNEHNLGFNQNFRTVTMRATGDLVAISDQDDVWFPEKIEKQVKAIGNYDICASSYTRGETIEHAYTHLHQSSLEALLFAGFAGHTMLLKKSFIKDKKSWLDFIIYDWALAINAQLNNGIIMLNEPLNWHRTHNDSACTEYNRLFYKQNDIKPTWQPYFYGIYNYYRLQKKPKWQKLYKYIYDRSYKKGLMSAHKMSSCMLKKNPISLIQLCWLCMKQREKIYPIATTKNNKYLKMLRAFFYPFIFAFHNTAYE